MFQKMIEKAKFNKNLKKARILDEPLCENTLSVIYSTNNRIITFLTLENSTDNLHWPGMKQFGFINKITSENFIGEMLKDVYINLTPLLSFEEAQKNRKNFFDYGTIKFNMSDKFLNMETKVYLIEIDDYMLRSCRGKKNDKLTNMNYLTFEDLTKIIISDIKFEQQIQPHFRYLFWIDKLHIKIYNKYRKNKNEISEIFI
jgi:hypothetical protein